MNIIPSREESASVSLVSSGSFSHMRARKLSRSNQTLRISSYQPPLELEQSARLGLRVPERSPGHCSSTSGSSHTPELPQTCQPEELSGEIPGERC